MWNEKRTLQFIELYKGKRLLWDNKHAHYYNKGLKEDAWEDVAAKLDATTEECRRKMFSLQSSLRREKCKIRKSQAAGREADDTYISNWFAFKSLSFLLDMDKSWKMTTDTKRAEIPPEEDSSSDYEPRLRQPVEKKRKVNDAEDRSLAKSLPLSAASTSKTDEEDISQLFGSLVAKRMRMYSPLVQSAVQQAVMTVLFNADRGYYDQKSSSPVFDPAQPQHSQYLQHGQSSSSSQFVSVHSDHLKMSPTYSSDAVQVPVLSPVSDGRDGLEYI